MESESLLDDAISVAEVEMGEPTTNNMVATNDVSTITDDSQTAPIEIDAPADSPAQATQAAAQAAQPVMEAAPAAAPAEAAPQAEAP